MEDHPSSDGFFQMLEKVVILLDGGFVRPKLRQRINREVNSEDIVGLCAKLLEHPKLEGYSLYRAFYYDSAPFSGKFQNPISGVEKDYSNTQVANHMRRLLDTLELKENFAVRTGQLLRQGWKLSQTAERRLSPQATSLEATDIRPNFKQKGVDQRIGLDIAWIAMKKLVAAMVLVTGDSDFVPAMKFARKEGVKAFLFSFNHAVVRELKAHADVVIPDGEIVL